MAREAGFPVLERAHVRLRELVPADAADLLALRGDPQHAPPGSPPLRTLDQAHDLIERLATEYREEKAIRWGVTLAGEDTVVGVLGYTSWDIVDHRAALDHDMGRALWGRGPAAEAVGAVLDHGFGPMALNRVEAHVDAGDVRSIRMLRGLGFWREGTFHEHHLVGGAFHDVALLVLLRRDRVPHIAATGQPRNMSVTRRS